MIYLRAGGPRSLITAGSFLCGFCVAFVFCLRLGLCLCASFPLSLFCAGEPGACAFFLCFYALVLLAAFGVALFGRFAWCLDLSAPLRSRSLSLSLQSQKKKRRENGSREMND
jgi:hypothetical protein